MYERLAGPEGAGVPWSRLHVLWGDERCVPSDDPRSNYRMALESGLLSVPPAGIHRMPGELPPEEGAFRYEQELRALFPEDGFPRLDLVLLGLGEDGHVASLVPGSAALQERELLGRRDRAVPGDPAPDAHTPRVGLGSAPALPRDRREQSCCRPLRSCCGGGGRPAILRPFPCACPHAPRYDRVARRAPATCRGTALPGDLDRRRSGRFSAALFGGRILTRNRPRLDAEPSAPVGYEEEDLMRGRGGT